MPTPMAMVNVADAACHDDNPFGYYPYLRQRGWSAAYAERPWGASDIPSADELIASGLGFVLNRGCGLHKDGEGLTIGHSPFGGGPIICSPRGPGAFARFDEIFGPNGLESFEKETRDRTDRVRANGRESAIFIGGPKWDAFTPQTAEKIVQRTLTAWKGPLLRAGFDWVMFDSVTATEQWPGKEGPCMRLAESLLLDGVKVAGETIPAVTPGCFAWASGRFGMVASPEDRAYRSGAGYFNRACVGTATRRFLWLQGSIPPIQRVTMLQTELADPNGDDPITDFAGCWPVNPTSVGGTPSHTPSCPTAPSPSGLPDAFPAGPQ